MIGNVRFRPDGQVDRLFFETEVVPPQEPIAGPPIVMQEDPILPRTFGTDGASALYGYPEAEQRMKTSYGSTLVRADRKLENKTMGIFSRACRYIRGKMGHYASYFVPERVGAADVFQPDRMPINGRKLPVGQIEAFYHPKKDEQFIDEGAIYGTRKNHRLRNIYKWGINEAKKVGGPLGKRLREFYRNMVNKLEDREAPVRTMVHESTHAGLEKTGLAYKLSTPQNEGLTCALTDEMTGRSSTVRGTTYDDFKRLAYRALYKMGFRSAAGFVRKYIDGEVSGRSYARAATACGLA